MSRSSLVMAAIAALVLVRSVTPVAQVELDRIVSRVGGRTITRTDVEIARALRLVADTSSETATQRALENRLLALGEVSRLQSAPPVSDEALAARRTAWEAAAGPADVRRRLMATYELSDADLASWFRDDLRIEALLGRQFGLLESTERERVVAEWYNRLRQRADLR